MNFIGELAALATSFFFAMTALIFTQTGRMVGSQVTNRMRLTFALIYLVIINLVLFSRASAVFRGRFTLALAGVLRGHRAFPGRRVPVSGARLVGTAPRLAAIESRPDLWLDHRLGLLW